MLREVVGCPSLETFRNRLEKYVRNYLGRADPTFGQSDELNDLLRSFLVLFSTIL